MKVYERYPAWMNFYRGGRLSILAHPLRFALSRLYGFHAAHRPREAGRPVVRASDPCIVSIGNLEWGGGGKTPCAIALCEALTEKGLRPVVVTRGYRSEAERNGPYIVAARGTPVGPDGMRCIDEEGLGGRVIGYGDDCGADSLARLIGDEPSLYRAHGIPVVIDRRRARGVEIAARVFEPTHLILDDAFQNRDTPRDVDILLLDQEKPFGTGELMPLGNLRESPQAARRADIVIFTRSVSDHVPPEAAEAMCGKPVFFSNHRPARLITRSGERLSLEHLRGRRVALLSGIARPDAFEGTVLSLGAVPVVSFRFADHHEYRSVDVAWTLDRMERGGTIVTTEKDMVKVARLFPDDIDLAALGIDMEIRGLDRLLEYITGGRRPAPGSPQTGDTTSS
jgi:tetraacyldisaccharide 4'-kinase